MDSTKLCHDHHSFVRTHSTMMLLYVPARGHSDTRPQSRHYCGGYLRCICEHSGHDGRRRDLHFKTKCDGTSYREGKRQICKCFHVRSFFIVMAFRYETDIMKLSAKGWFARRWLFFMPKSDCNQRSLYSTRKQQKHMICAQIFCCPKLKIVSSSSCFLRRR